MAIKTKKKATSVAKKTPATVKKAQTKKPINDKIIVGWKTVNSDMQSWYDSDYKFTVGKEHTTHIDRSYGSDSCGPELHFGKTEEDAMNHTSKEDFIMLEVQTYERDILGQDDEKIRTKKLKVNKILETKTIHGEEWQEALKEVKEVVSKKLLKPNASATPQKLTALVAAYAKATKLPNVKMHLIDNVYELKYALGEIGYNGNLDSSPSDRTCDEICNLNFVMPDIMDDLYNDDEGITDALRAYVGSHQYGADKSDLAQSKPIFEMLSLGCYPVGFTVDNKHYIVFRPTEDLSKMKILY